MGNNKLESANHPDVRVAFLDPMMVQNCYKIAFGNLWVSAKDGGHWDLDASLQVDTGGISKLEEQQTAFHPTKGCHGSKRVADNQRHKVAI